MALIFFGGSIRGGSYYLASGAENNGVIAAVSAEQIGQLRTNVTMGRAPTSHQELVANAKVAAFQLLINNDDSLLRKVLQVGYREVPEPVVQPVSPPVMTKVQASAPVPLAVAPAVSRQPWLSTAAKK